MRALHRLPKLALLCGAAGSACSSSAPSTVYEGVYEATGPGAWGQIELRAGGHYALARNAPCSATPSAANACTESGTFVVDTASNQLTLKRGDTGTTTHFPLGQASAVSSALSPAQADPFRVHGVHLEGFVASADGGLTNATGPLTANAPTSLTVCQTGPSGSSGGTSCGPQCQPMALTSTSIVVTASSVQALHGKLTSVQPRVTTPSQPSQYLEADSCLGGVGPLSAWGPLGTLGPVGDNSWNSSLWINAGYSSSSEWFSQVDGPVSESGPLGPKGPLSDEAYNHTMPAINGFSKQLQAGGVWTVLGPIGPLGALGPLGPLGPIGAHPSGAADDNGAYGGRTVDVPYQGCNRTYGLVESYKESFAKSMTDNDTSFMVVGSLDSESEKDTYSFTSPETQFVTAIVVAENGLSDFDLEIDESGQKITSNSDGGSTLGAFFVPVSTGEYIDWIHFSVAAQTPIKATVSAKSLAPGFPTYRLIVTGSTQYISTTDISGNHQK
jgi:hypothetical protein